MNRIEQVSRVGEAKVVPNELPHFEVATDGGYFQLSHSVFRDPKLRELPGDTFRLYLWLSSQGWRFRDSDGTLRASVSFITEALGLPHATVSRGLKLLKEGGLIRLVETDFKRGNLWWITPRAAWTPPGGKGPQREVSRSEVPQFGMASPSKRGRSHLNLSGKLPQNEAEIRNTIPFKKLENSLSEKFPGAIRDYLENIRLPRKRERERACYLQLSSVYGVEEITEALRFVRERGVPGSGESCHSPMAFLARAMGEVLAELRRVASTESKAAERARQQEVTRANECAENHRQQAEWERKERAFLTEFPTPESQEKAVSEWAAQLPWKLSNPGITRNLAISGWWESAQRAGLG